MLPIALKSFHIKNYRGIIDTQIDNIPPDTQWIFLTGENGFGKTSVLQGIAQRIFEDSKIKVSIGSFSSYLQSKKTILEYYLHEKNNKLGQNNVYRLRRRVGFIGKKPLHLFAAYGSSRLRTANSISRESNNDISNFPHNSLMNTETLLYDIEQALIDSNAYSKDLFYNLEDIFKNLIHSLIEIKIEVIENRPVVKYYEADEKGNKYKEGTNFTELAAGYKNIIATIGDMIFKLMDISAYKPGENRNLKSLFGIVLIDEFELHLHPKYQKLFVQKLTELFPKIQFIVSTHSPIPLLGAPKNSVVIKVSRTREEGIKAELLDIDFSVLTPNAILSSPIFGFQDLIPESKSDDEMIRTEDTYKEVLFNDQLDKQISEYLTKDNQKELLDLLKEHNL